MKEIPNKVTNNTYTAEEFTEGVKEELQGAVSNTFLGAEVFDETNQTQLMQGLTRIAGGTSFYTDSGGANAYELSLSNPFTAVGLTTYYSGLVVEFIATAVNTGASTASVAGLTATNIQDGFGNDIAQGTIQPNTVTKLLFQVGSPDKWILLRERYAPIATARISGGQTPQLFQQPFNITSLTKLGPSAVRFFLENPAPNSTYAVYVSMQNDPTGTKVVSYTPAFQEVDRFDVEFIGINGTVSGFLPNVTFDVYAVQAHF